MVFLLVCVGVLALGCGGLFGPGTATVVDATPGACGRATLHVQADSSWFERQLEVIVAGGPPVRTVVLPPRTGELFVEVPLPSQGSTAVSVAFEGDPASAPIHVAVPALDAAIASDLSGPIPADAPPRLPLRVLGPCVGTTPFAITATLAGDRPLVVQQAVADDGTLVLDLPELRQGTWEVEAVLLHAQGPAPPTEIARRTLAVTIGPPCVDQDGDGHLACEGDCDDGDPAIHPGARDVVGDGIDSDCDGVNGRDGDRDGHEDVAVGGDDCDDGDPRVPATAPPDGDGDGAYAWTQLDWDCDGVPEDPPGAWDCDDDDPAVPRPEAAEPNGIDDDGDGFAEQDGDCDDTDPRISPDAREAADCRDNDCDGQIDEGVQRPRQDDRYEPNDETPYELAGAVRKKPILGFPGGYKPTRQRLVLTTRDATDVERFSLWTHDGGLDGWHVTAEVLSMGDERSYDVIVEGGGRTRSAVVEAPGGTVRMQGQGFSDNTGTYTIEIRPRAGERAWCPLEVAISSG